jgi:hypothetical protein
VVCSIGRSCNREAIGSAIKLSIGSGHTLYKGVSSGAGFVSSCGKRAHFTWLDDGDHVT